MNHKVFLSFAMEDKSLVDQFRVQAQKQHLPFAFRDYAVRDEFDTSWKSQAERIIRSSSLTLCFVGRGTYQSEPVNWEIQKSIELDKPVVAVYLVDEELPLPQALQEHSITPVSWQMQGIARAIERATS